MKVKLTDDARRDFELIVDGTAAYDARARDRLEARLRQALRMLSRHPEIGRYGDMPGTREVSVVKSPYRIVYGLTATTVIVYRIIHGAMRWPPGDDE